MYSLLAVVVLGLAIGETYAENGEMFSRASYPNPRVDLGSCGRSGRKSWICDPHAVLDYDESNQLDNLIEMAYNSTACPCSKEMCKQQPGGYRIAVAIVQKMDVSEKDKQNEYPSMEDIDKTLHRAKLFTYTLKLNWDFGRCKEDVIILYSVEDNVLYTMTGKVAKLKLNGRALGEIAMTHRTYFNPGNDIFMGLQNVIKDYIAVFRGNFQGLNYEEAKPRYAAVVGRNSASSQATGMISLLVVVAASALKTLW